MAECDANYIRLLKLMPSLEYRATREFTISSQADAADEILINIAVIEKFKYTSTLRIIQQPKLGKLSRWLAAPHMTIRVYHDAKTAEVTQYQNQRHFEPIYSVPNANMNQPDEKKQINEFLSEWLTLCLHAGRSVHSMNYSHSVQN